MLENIPKHIISSPNVHSILIRQFDCQKLYASSSDFGEAFPNGMSRKDSMLYAESPTMNN